MPPQCTLEEFIFSLHSIHTSLAITAASAYLLSHDGFKAIISGTCL